MPSYSIQQAKGQASCPYHSVLKQDLGRIRDPNHQRDDQQNANDCPNQAALHRSLARAVFGPLKVYCLRVNRVRQAGWLSRL